MPIAAPSAAKTPPAQDVEAYPPKHSLAIQVQNPRGKNRDDEDVRRIVVFRGVRNHRSERSPKQCSSRRNPSGQKIYAPAIHRRCDPGRVHRGGSSSTLGNLRHRPQCYTTQISAPEPYLSPVSTKSGPCIRFASIQKLCSLAPQLAFRLSPPAERGPSPCSSFTAEGF